MKITSRKVLEAKLAEINSKIENSGLKYSVELDDDSGGNEFKFYLLFENWPSLLADNGIAIDNELIFYNRYYRFSYFLKLYSAKHGYDVGLEQQAFRLLEDSETLNLEVDWDLITKIESDIKNLCKSESGVGRDSLNE
jgi:hypothetical protein